NNTTGGGGNSYTWNFGDGTGTSAQQNPSHTYNIPGTYTVTLAATLGSCNDIDSIVSYITVNPSPTAGFSAANVCLGDAMNFTNSSSGATGYTWDFGDGTGNSTSTNPSYTYTTANTFTVTLVASNGLCTDTLTQSVVVNNTPQVSFSSSGATTGCDSLTVNFLNNSTGGGGNSYTWNFGDGIGTSSQQAPSYTYTSPGTYTVTLAATLGSCSDVDSIVSYITVNVSPAAGFSSTNVCLGDAMPFTNSSTGATSYTWDFGDGTGTSISTNPSYTYTTANTFTVTLVASNGLCTDTITQSVVVNNAPQVSFTTSGATTGCGPLTVNFVNNTTGGGGNSYAWNFGDGIGTSSLQDPSYTFTAAGTYTVSLAATLGSCIDADSIIGYITVNASPTAAFTASNVCLGDLMNFTNSSAGATGYTWDFGDGTGTSTSTNPSYTYTTANTFTVTLVATDGLCTDTLTQTVVVNNAPQVSFTSTGATSGCGSVTVNFLNNTTGGAGNSYTWNFGDGTGSSSLQNPTYVYTIPGTYTVTLTATVGSCMDVDSIVNYITVTPGPIASFNAGSVCLGETVNFVNTSSGATSYLWDFGDGTGTSTLLNPTHVYSVGNTFTITLISTDGNCADTVTQTVTVNPAPNVAFSANATTACDSLTVTFTNNTTGATSYNWDFGDGFFSTDVNPVHTYNVPGVYSVTLNGIVGICISSQTSVNLISIYETPHATVTASSNFLCPNDCVNFTSTSTGSPNMWAWNFPGSTTSISSSQNPPNICYPSAGTFNVVLNVSNGHCSSSQTLTGFIVVNPCTSLVAGFISSDTLLCKGSCINFTSTSQNASSYLWSFPGATPASSTQPNPNSICYPLSGSYDVTLIVSNGATFDTLTMTNFIVVASPPAPPVFTQNGDTLTSSPAATYQWYFGSFQINGATNQTYVAQASGNYYVIITDNNGCQATSAQGWVSLIGINELNDATLVYLYPNPVLSHLTIMIETSQRPDIHYELMDAIGKKILWDEFTLTQSPMKKELDLSALASGIYFITIESKGSSVVKKIVKQ
ncbi:MAG: PKD domain-containing protein, partial [Bacteroidota bacterium]